MKVVAGIDLGGTAINYTLITSAGQFLIEGLCEHPSLCREGPQICIQQIVEGLAMALKGSGLSMDEVVTVGLDTPGPASAQGVLSAQGSTNFGHADWRGFDIRGSLETALRKPVTYLNDGNAAAIWGHFSLFGTGSHATSVSVVIGTGLGGGIVIDDHVIKGRKGFGGELGHMLVPYHMIRGLDGLVPYCNCGRQGDLESLCSLTAIGRNYLPHLLKLWPDHELGRLNDLPKAAKSVRGLAERGDTMCRDIFRAQAAALGIFFDSMVNTFDPDALIVGGGAIETSDEFQSWFLNEIRAAMPAQRTEQADIPLKIMPNGDTAGARGVAVDALQYARRQGLI